MKSSLKVKYQRYATNSDGELEMVFSTKDIFKAKQAIAKILDVDLSLSLEKYTEKRSLSANAYLWTLCEKIAKKLRSTKEDIYKRFIRDCGETHALSIKNEAVESFALAWKSRGLGWFVDIADSFGKTTLVHVYYGSSSYNKEQMQRLLDSVIDECKRFGIETKTPNEIAEIMSLWGSR